VVGLGYDIKEQRWLDGLSAALTRPYPALSMPVLLQPTYNELPAEPTCLESDPRRDRRDPQIDSQVAALIALSHRSKDIDARSACGPLLTCAEKLPSVCFR